MSALGQFRLARSSPHRARVQARALEQPVARRIGAVHHDQRLVDEAADVLDRSGVGVPVGIARLVAQQALRLFEPKCSREDARAREGPSLRLVEQALAPVEGRAQRAMSRQSGARAVGQHLQAIVQARAHGGQP